MSSSTFELAGEVRPEREAAGTTVSIEQPTFKLGRRLPLDGIRGAGVFVVMLSHLGFQYVDGSIVLMDLFFVLSGFLITALLMQEQQRTGEINLKNFYTRRALRLFPALFSLLAVCALYMLVQPPDGAAKTLKIILHALFYVGNWVQAYSPTEVMGPLNHTWSLSLEEQFYTLWPVALLLLLASRMKRRHLILLLLAGAAFSAIERAVLYTGGATRNRVYYGLDTHLDALLIGCVIGLLATWNLLPQQGTWKKAIKHGGRISALVLLASVVFFTRTSPFLYEGGLLFINLASALLILEVVIHPEGGIARVLQFPLLVWLGELSYGLYLWHYPIFRQFQWGGISGAALKIVLSIGVAAASYYLLERRFLNLKTRFSPGAAARETPGNVRLVRV
jgi:peptidoglycan/LPS O-acetylase OafA/YrhL